MATTVYTYNDKVLKNVATDKWLKKPDAPAGFVMDASNATISGYWVSWQSPSYPDPYVGDGKQYILVNNNTEALTYIKLMYANVTNNGGPDAISNSDMIALGTTTGTLANNTHTAAGFGTYLNLVFAGEGLTEEQVQAYIANVTITIVDP